MGSYLDADFWGFPGGLVGRRHAIMAEEGLDVRGWMFGYNFM